MADTLAIRRRIRSISSTRQITKAMQLVAASKLRAAAAAAVNAQAYRRQLDDILTQVAGTQEWHTHPLLRLPQSGRAHLVLIGSDHTLAGAYHSRLEALLAEVVAAEQEAGRQVEVTTIGRIPAAMPRRLQGVEIAGSYAGPAVLPTIWEVHTIVAELLQRYQVGEIGSLKVLTTRFMSALRQSTEVWDLLPLAAPNAGAEAPEMPGSTVANDSPQSSRLSGVSVTTSPSFVPPTLEPDPESAITQAAQTWLQAAFLDAATTAVASEHAMRMIAMQNATNNAGDLIDDLTLEYNNARQAAITQELAEITGGAAAIT